MDIWTCYVCIRPLFCLNLYFLVIPAVVVSLIDYLQKILICIKIINQINALRLYTLLKSRNILRAILAIEKVEYGKIIKYYTKHDVNVSLYDCDLYCVNARVQ